MNDGEITLNLSSRAKIRLLTLRGECCRVPRFNGSIGPFTDYLLVCQRCTVLMVCIPASLENIPFNKVVTRLNPSGIRNGKSF